MLRKVIKAALPFPLWNAARNNYNQIRYRLLWQRREVASFEQNGTEFSFLVVDKMDCIQRIHSDGKFYEQEDLTLISQHFPKGGTFVDVGANTGQHSVYLTKLFDAKAILFEPIPQTCNILCENVRLNKIEDRCDLSFLGYGLSDKKSNVSFSLTRYNLGAASLFEADGGSIPTIAGDDAIAGRHVDFVKIDTEGYEIKVLNGLRGTIARSRPVMYIEVDDHNGATFEALLKDIGYSILYRKKVYQANENFLVRPI